MSNHSIIEHRASYHFIKLEEDFLAICSNGKCSPHCKAFILSIIEHWMNTKRAKGEGDYAYLTMPEWIKHMYMLYERNVIENCIKELLEEKLITRRSIKRHGQKTFEYTLNVDLIQELIRALPAKRTNEGLPNLDNYLAHRDKIKAEKREAREKSRTLKAQASEKSRTFKDSEKSRTSSEKSRTLSSERYVKNHSNIDSITEITTEIESMSSESNKSTNVDSFIPSSSCQNNASNLSDEQKRIIEYLDALDFEFDLTDLNKEHLIKIAQKIHSFEEMKSLYDFTSRQEHLKGKQLYLGNLANTNNLSGWKQHKKKQEQPSQPNLQASKTYGKDLKEAHRRMIEEFKAKEAAARK